MASKKSQKALLQKLEEYGDSLFDNNKSKKSKKLVKKQQKKADIESMLENQGSQDLHVTPVRKKKLNKKQRKLLKNQQNGDIVKSNKKPHLTKKIKWLREALGSDGAFDIEQKRDVTSTETLGDKTKHKKEAEVIVFEDPTRRKKKPNTLKERVTSQTDTSREFDMRSARFEVRKLGISGFAGEQKSDARVSLLINLGAKPPRKKSYMNYKEFQQKRKMELDAETQRRHEEQVPGEKIVKNKSKKRPHTKPDFGVDGQVGCYKDGVQYINKDILKKIKKS